MRLKITHMITKTMLKQMLILSMLIIILTLTATLASAKCEVEFVTYYGQCDTDGDILVSDSNGAPVAEQLYGVDKGCYKGAYAISVPGGGEDDCLASSGDKLSFSVSGKKYAEAEWVPDSKIINLDLQRPRYKEPFTGISPGSVYLLLTILVMIVISYLATQFYRRKNNE